ncbi:ATP synthase F0 subunit C [Mycoplasmopsis sturni]|uniref:ATP synthase F0 subunit C n=1 Tax=Mycoplasmopsis sturni TaxID=39047 RepID=UPI00055A3A09|nr:ATP synthase F0 subunit C [Mycoplasmopsis sturni]
MIQNLTKLFEDTATTTPVASDTTAKAAEQGTSIGFGLVCLGAGVAMIGALGSAVGQGFAGGKAVEAISRNPEAESKIRTMFIITAGISESAAIYCLVIAFLLFFLGK